jgi:hypothetical protein
MAFELYIPQAPFHIRPGRIRVTAAAAELDMSEPLIKHIDGDWGSDPVIDYLSCWGAGSDGPMVTIHGRICVLSEPDRSYTTLMLVNEIADYQFEYGELDYVAEYADLAAFMLGEEGA